MRNFVLLCLGLGMLWGCSDDDGAFVEAIASESVSFTPAAGGAVMRYSLPKNADVVGIRVRYRNAYGEDVLRTGSYACDTMVLSGFNEATQDVPATVTLCDRAGNESAAVAVNFDTKDSGPILFFNELKVYPNWEGFKISYNIPEMADGMAHVLYVGENPVTGEPDTLLLNSFYFTQGTDTLSYKLQQEYAENTVVIRTEDIQGGRMVKQNVYEHVKSYNMEFLSPSSYVFTDPEGLSVENEATMLSKDYLFDGDTKGLTSFGLQRTAFGTYLAGPEAFGRPLFVIDLQETKYLAEVRLYTIINIRRYFAGLFMNVYEERLPCKVRVFGSNAVEDESSWVELGYFGQDKALDPTLRWCEKVPSSYFWGGDEPGNREEIQAATSYYMAIQFSPEASAYRYLKLVVEETFESCWGVEGTNVDHYVTFHEFEIYTKKD